MDHVIAPLDRDHARVVTELAVDHRRAGDRSGGRRPGHPHVTLLDRGLTPHLLGRAVEVLAGRPQRTWSITVGSVAIGCRAHVTEAADRELPLGRTDPAAPSLGRACRGPTPEAPA